MNKKLSVIVPIYGVETYLKKCLDSIICQTYNNLEIILVDDGSPDRCPEICDEYAKKDSRITVIHKQNGGLSDARNVGLSIATGEYVTFVDSDDWLENNMYECLMVAAEQNSVKMAVGGVKVFDENSGTYRKDYGSQAITERIVKKENYIREVFLGIWSAWDKIYHRSLFENIKFPIGEFNEDEAIMLDLIDKCEEVYITTNPLYVHFVRATDSLTAARFTARKIDWFRHCQRNLDIVKKFYPLVMDAAEFRYLTSLMWCLNNMTSNPDEFSSEIYELSHIMRKNIFRALRNRYLSKKEKIRSVLIGVNYKLFCKAVHLLKKKYT